MSTKSDCEREIKLYSRSQELIILFYASSYALSNTFQETLKSTFILLAARYGLANRVYTLCLPWNSLQTRLITAKATRNKNRISIFLGLFSVRQSLDLRLNKFPLAGTKETGRGKMHRSLLKCIIQRRLPPPIDGAGLRPASRSAFNIHGQGPPGSISTIQWCF